MPCYNIADYIESCIASIATSVGYAVEIETIFIDDCSTDETRNVIRWSAEEYGLSNFKIIELSENGGLANARNVAIDHSGGEHLLFLDGDNMVLPGFWDYYTSRFSFGAADVVIPEMEIVDSLGHRTDKRYYRDILGVDPRDSLRRRFPLLFKNSLDAFAIMRREALGNLRFDSGLRLFEDWDFWLTLLASGAAFEFEEQPLGLYRFNRPGSLTAESNARKVRKGGAFVRIWWRNRKRLSILWRRN